jgi:hypothetical protein
MAFVARLRALLTGPRLARTLAISAVLPFTGVYLTLFDWSVARYTGMLPWFLGFGVLIMLCMSCAEAVSASRPVPTTWYVASVVTAAAIAAACGAALAQPLRASFNPPPLSTVNQRAVAGLPPQNPRVAMALVAGIHVMFYGLFVVLTHSRLQRVRQAARALSEAEIAREDALREMALAKLAAARVAIDAPAVIARLEEVEGEYDRDIAGAERLLDELIAELRDSIPRVREARARTAS